MAKATRAEEQVPEVGLRPVESIFDELERIRELITNRAYEFFEEAGGRDGRELDHWLRAEREMVLSPPIELRERDGELTLEVAVAGFELGDLDVRITTEDVLIQSERVPEERNEDETVYQSEFRRGKLFRDVQLPHAIDPDRARARYRNGLLEITAPLLESAASRQVQITES